MEERILDLLKKDDKALSVTDINDLLGLKTVDELKELMKTLNKMEDHLQVYRTKKNNYLLFSNSHLKVGSFISNRKGFGFVDIDGDEDIFIAPPNLNDALHGDRVIVEVISHKGSDLEGKIIKIVNRKLDLMVGEIVFKNNKLNLILDDEKVNIIIEINPKKTMGAMDGHKVLVKLGSKAKKNIYKGEVVKIIGHKNDPGVDILSIVYQMGIKDAFEEKILEEADKTPDIVLESEYKNRKDLRKEIIFTIDGDDTKDIDDAISFKVLENKNFELGVHIADVSYYVKKNSAIDKEARERGTSVYLTDRVIPMLPHKLSNGICSLNPNVERLAVSCVMEIDNEGKILSADIFESVIESKKQMTYKNVNKILEENIIPEGYEEYSDTIIKMNELATKLRSFKEFRGYIDFDLNESKIIVDDKGKAIDVVLRDRGMGEKLIEDFMIASNEAVATHIHLMNLPFVYRVHGKPNDEKIANFLRFVNILGYKVTGKIDKITPKAMQDLLNQLKEKKEFYLLSVLLLRSMQKAVYDTNNIGHFGIASDCYTHFTSPIRRYPDTTVHRLLREYLFECKYDTEYWEKELPDIVINSSNMERVAIDCERAVDDMKKAEYMEDHIGEEYDGVVGSVMSFGMFIELPNLIEGLVRIDSLKDDFYCFDESTFSIRGNKEKRGYRLGDSVRVKVVRASKESRTIDFEIVV